MAAAAMVSVSMGVMKPVLAKLTILMGDEYSKLKGLRKEVTFLKHELSDLDAILEKMDNADELDPQAKNWRKGIIDMSYDIEDFIDDFTYRIGEADNKVGILTKASQYLRTFKDRFRLANQLQEIKTLVIQAGERRKRYLLDQCISITTPVVVDPRLSTLYKESASLVGLKTQQVELVNWVMDKRQSLEVMAIVGFGGLGKTTLANEVYREVQGQFEYKAFVSVSQKPDMIRLFNSMLSQLGLHPYSHLCQLQDLINNVRGHLQDKRYFIIVDDLWDIRTWDTIQCAFPQNNQCSRVMVTTRNKNVARSCTGNHGFIHDMKPLSEEDSRKLFFRRIFGSEDDCPLELMAASCGILKKCGGSPLAVITVASMLACQPIRLQEHWEYIQNSLAKNFATDHNFEDMMYILDLSYKNLPHHLRACFLYLGSYPEDYEINRVDLVRRWVAEGFVSNSIGQDVWEAADSYFNELVNRSLIQPTYAKYFIRISGCRVHDMLLELILRRCKEDNIVTVVNDPKEVAAEAQDKVIRRLSIVGLSGIEDGKSTIITKGMNLSKIRCLTILRESNWVPPLMEFKFVRVLFLEVGETPMDLTNVNNLLQLRYFKVEGYSQSTVPPCQIRRLQLLETMDLSRLYNCRISLEIVDVPRLSHLAVPKDTRLPDWIGKVISLHTLHGFTLPMDSLESIIGLGKLTTLSDLSLHFPKAMGCAACAALPKATWLAALGTSLEKLSILRQLHLMEPYHEISWCADLLGSLSPPFRNLEFLDMSACTFSRVPRWIGHLHNIRVLRLGAKQILEEDVSVIGSKLPSLVELSLRIPDIPTERIILGGSTGFLAVRYFKFYCNGMSYLEFEAGAMPELRELELIFGMDGWDKTTPSGLQYLPSLERIEVVRAMYKDEWWRFRRIPRDDEEVEVALIRGVFLHVIEALPTHPAFFFKHGIRNRPIEEDEYYSKVSSRVD